MRLRAPSQVASLDGVEKCAECGFDYGASGDLAAAITAGADSFAARLETAGDDVRARRDPQVWSPLEYGCHLRDMLLVQRERLLAARRREKPSFETMGRDERVVHDGYALQNPATVADELRMAAEMFAGDLELLGDSDWERPVIYNYPERAERTLRWVAAHTLHEVRHHLMDVDRQLR